MAKQEHQFETEVQELLHLMIHSLYSNKDIFLRELISNASDAIDKRRYEALTNEALKFEHDPEIRISVDKTKRTLSVIDNGIGMTAEDLVQNLGTIARSGTKEFAAALKAQQKSGSSPESLIGQFGVGFYASFMVAEKVEVLTRRPGSDGAHLWVSEGKGSYSIEESTRSGAGTTVTLYLKDIDEENGLRDYTSDSVLASIVKQHSDFVSHPIRMKTERQEPVLDDDGKPVVGTVPKLVTEDQTLNSQQALWTRSRSEITEEEYKDFYRHVSGDWNEPLEVIHASMEGMFEATMLMFIPKQAPWDLYSRERAFKGLQLFVKRVFIMDDCEELLPEWLRFVKGVVDSEDLSLNVSREILQQDRQVRAIRKFLVKRILDSLSGLAASKPEDYQAFWKEFGPVLKEGLAHPEFASEHTKLLKLMRVHSTRGEGLISLEEYVSQMAEGQEKIHFLTGPKLEGLRASPHLEGYVAAGREVLLLADPIDEFWVNQGLDFEGKSFESAAKGSFEQDAQVDEEVEKSRDDDHKALFDTLRRILQDEVKEIRFSSRLKESPACLVGEKSDLTPQLEQLMKKLGQEPPKTKRILELNPSHPLIAKLGALAEADPKAEELGILGEVLYGQCVLAEAGTLENPAHFAKRLTEMMQRSAEALS